MTGFVRQRGVSLAAVVLVMVAIGLAQNSISYTVAFGALGIPLKLHLTALATFGSLLRWGLLILMAAFWLMQRRAGLFRLVIIVNASDTLVLFLHAGFLACVLVGLSVRTIKELFLDVALMAISNVLVFSIWYWIIDPPGIDNVQHATERWAFLFPQRANALPGFGQWQPQYADYLFVAFTTSLAFSPTDTSPLTRIAKMLMLLQAIISVITLTGIAGSAINILAGTASGTR